MTAFETRQTDLQARNRPDYQQIAAPRHTRFTRTPSTTPQPSTIQGSPPPHRASPQFEANPHTNKGGIGRWRGEELRTFDPAIDNVYTFTDRINQVAGLRGHRLIQLNLSLQLRGAAKA